MVPEGLNTPTMIQHVHSRERLNAGRNLPTNCISIGLVARIDPFVLPKSTESNEEQKRERDAYNGIGSSVGCFCSTRAFASGTPTQAQNQNERKDDPSHATTS